MSWPIALQKPVELSCAGATHEQWSCSGWNSCLVFDISWSSWTSLRGWSADHLCCSLCSAILSHSSRHTWRNYVFKTREEHSMLNVFLVFLQGHGWFLYPLPPKRLRLDSQDAASNVVAKMPHCTLNTLKKIRKQLMVGEGTCSYKTQVVRGARAAHEQSYGLGDSVQPRHCPPHPVPPWGSPLIGALKSLACYTFTLQLAFLKVFI